MAKTKIKPIFERRRSKIHGWGVFATAPINKNKRIIDYDGEKITHKQSAVREDRYLSRGHIWCFKINNSGFVMLQSEVTPRGL